jgi:hypothetical protein
LVDPELIATTPEAISLFRKMRRLEPLCQCVSPEQSPDLCDACERWWALNAKLGAYFGLPAWEIAYAPDDPAYWPTVRVPQSALDRYRLLEAAAASKATKAQKFKFKWQK